ncbi:thioester reductase domain-containing protein [Streptomyces paludis]|uniref:NAD-dependent epimerase/dehydratase family protein n=1 Tax=Streptomyces paludis TaxID=2282738 RepID=A0A345HY41_9ACTN|nr:thioester reductase domain-containing protein [Streptomyces paludis]AXG81615.1 NAD-dependent epimerase/dehydratase family protein [Streptomyces paludis]
MASTIPTEVAEEFAADVVLADDITGFPAPAPETVSDVFLTGATGFLGAFLLRDLLREGLVVHCLVRGADAGVARQRLTDNLRTYELLDGLDAVDLDRVHVYTGDVTKPRLGLPEDVYAELAGRVGAVYHSAAKVNFLTLYKWLRKSTVESTHGILRFACAARAALHHVSTTGVFEPRRDLPARGELDPTGPGEALSLGYTRSKWVAEQLVLEASRRGVPVTVHRPGQVWGDSRTGACQPNDFVWRFIKGAIQIGRYPRRFRLEMNMVPVDYVSAVIVTASRHPEGLGGIYHQVSPGTLKSEEILRLLRGAGYELEEVSILKWMKAVAADVTNSMAPLLSILVESEKVEVAEFSDEVTRGLLEGSGVSCPDIDEKAFGGYIEYFVRHGVLPAPGADGASGADKD